VIHAAYEPLADRCAFRPDEPVMPATAFRPGHVCPLFGQLDTWDASGALDRPANRSAGMWRVRFDDLEPDWNLRSREMLMIWLNPRHRAVLEAGVHLAPEPRQFGTMRTRAGVLKQLAQWARDQRLPAHLPAWPLDAPRRFIAEQADRLTNGSTVEYVTVVKALHLFGPVLAGGGLRADPWPGRSCLQVAQYSHSDMLSTPVIRPETWFPLVRAAWTYIDVFAPDILRAWSRWQEIRAAATHTAESAVRFRLVERYLQDPANLVPVEPAREPGGAPVPNYTLLTNIVGADANHSYLFNANTPSGRARRALVAQAIAADRTQPGLLPDLAEVTRPDGSRGPWHQALYPRALWLERMALRNACYTFAAAMSMMRDSELREIAKEGGIVEFYGAPAIRSTKRKLDPDRPVKHWWIIDQAATAIRIAGEVTCHPRLAFGSVRPNQPELMFDSNDAVNNFVAHVNRFAATTGLDPIPAEHITPHMFRRTMAMLTSQYPGSEIAVGMQLKHAATRALANRSTGSYMGESTAWAAHFDTAQEAARFERLTELYDAHRRGEVIGYGPGAQRLRDAFDTVAHAADEQRATGQARHGDARVEHDLLKRARVSIRFGTLNHCTLDDANPIDAKCLENAQVPAGHTGPLPDRCRPSRCPNSMIAPEHVPLLQIERAGLDRLIDTPKLGANRRIHLQQERDEVNIMLKKVDQ
jgi:hypothetical protein